MEIDSVEFIDSATLQIRGSILHDEIQALLANGAGKVEHHSKEPEVFALSQLISAEIERILLERKIEMVGAPEFSLGNTSSAGEVQFAVKVGIYPEPEIEGYDAFEVVLQENREESGGGPQQQQLELVRQQVFHQLLERNVFDVPHCMIDEEIRNYLIGDGKISRSTPGDMSLASIREHRSEYEKKAFQRARLSIIIDQISAIEKIHAEEEDIELAIREIAELHESTYEETHEYLIENGFILEVVLAVTQEKVFQFLLERTIIRYRESG